MVFICDHLIKVAVVHDRGVSEQGRTAGHVERSKDTSNTLGDMVHSSVLSRGMDLYRSTSHKWCSTVLSRSRRGI